MSDLKLLPCPFCGGEAILCSTGNHFTAEKFFVSCGVCGVETPRIARIRKEAVAAWNHRAQPANEPLTLEELRGMDGEPVWIHRLEDNQGWWVAIKSTERDKVTTDYGGYFEFADYGKTWLAYRRPPERSENE